MVDRQRPIPAERFAEQAQRGVAKNRAIIVIPPWWKIAWWLYRLSPSLGLYLGRSGLATARRAMAGVPPDQPTRADSQNESRRDRPFLA